MVPIDDVSELRHPQKSAEQRLLDQEKESLLASSLVLLEEPYRTSLLLNLRGDSLEEIALCQQVSIGTVKSRLFRAREKIRQYLRDRLGGKGYERI